MPLDQGSDDLDTIEASIEQQHPDFDPQEVKRLEEPLQHLIHGHMGSDSAKGQGIAFAVNHGIGSGIGKKMRSALFGFASADCFFVFLFDSAMIRQFDQIDSDSASPLA